MNRNGLNAIRNQIKVTAPLQPSTPHLNQTTTPAHLPAGEVREKPPHLQWKPPPPYYQSQNRPNQPIINQYQHPYYRSPHQAFYPPLTQQQQQQHQQQQYQQQFPHHQQHQQLHQQQYPQHQHHQQQYPQQGRQYQPQPQQPHQPWRPFPTPYPHQPPPNQNWVNRPPYPAPNSQPIQTGNLPISPRNQPSFSLDLNDLSGIQPLNRFVGGQEPMKPLRSEPPHLHRPPHLAQTRSDPPRSPSTQSRSRSRPPSRRPSQPRGRGTLFDKSHHEPVLPPPPESIFDEGSKRSFTESIEPSGIPHASAGLSFRNRFLRSRKGITNHRTIDEILDSPSQNQKSENESKDRSIEIIGDGNGLIKKRETLNLARRLVSQNVSINIDQKKEIVGVVDLLLMSKEERNERVV